MEMLTEQQEPYNISSVISTHPDPVKRGLTEYEVLCGSQSILPWFGPHVPSVEYTFARLINSSVGGARRKDKGYRSPPAEASHLKVMQISKCIRWSAIFLSARALSRAKIVVHLHSF